MADKKFTVVLQGEDNLTPVVDKAGKSLHGLRGKVDESSDSLTRFNQGNRKGERTLNFAIGQGSQSLLLDFTHTCMQAVLISELTK